MLPKPIIELIRSRNHLRNLEKLMERDYPKELKQLLRSSSDFAEAVYLSFHKTPPGTCRECGKPTTFKNFVFGYKPFCGLVCGLSSKETSVKRATTNLKRFGSTTPMGNSHSKAKFKATMLKKYGVEWAMHSKDLRSKSIDTCRVRYGVDHHVESVEHTKHMLANSKAIQKNREATWMRKHGVRSPLQIPEVMERQQQSARTCKEVVIEGHIFRVQGYEEVVIRNLLEKGYKAEDVLNRAGKGKPSIPYTDKSGKLRYYFPDIAIAGTSNVIEVKSTWTLGSRATKRFNLNMRKFKAVETAGYDLWLAVVSGKKTREIVWIKNPHRRSRSDIQKLLSGIR